jgi:general secretion pathway protein J
MSPRRAGVTLLEVMVATVIIGIVSTLLYTGFSQTAANKRRIEQGLDREHEVRMGLERMVRELSMAYVSIHRNPSPALQTSLTCFIGSDEGGGSRIDFTSFSHRRLYRDAHESDQNELSYLLTSEPDGSSQTVLARREQHRVDDDPQEGGRTQVLIADVAGFELSYLDPLTGEWLSTWDSNQPAMQPNRLPTQVKILVTVEDERGRERVYGTRASLPMVFALNHAMYKP